MKPFVLALLLALACAPARTVTVGGREVAYEQAARDDFAKARTSLDQGRYELAVQQFGAFVQRYPDSELVDEALFRRAQALSRDGKLQQAQAALQQFLEQRPTSPFKGPAAVELAQVQARLGGAPSTAPQVDTSQMSEREKDQAAAALAETLLRSGQAGEALRWAARAVESANPEEREARLRELEAVLDAAPAPDVAKLVSELDRRSPAWAPSALKLSRVQLHTGDRAHAAELASDVLSADPQGRYAEGARAVQQAARPGAQLKPNLIGIVLPLTGDLKGFADQALNGIALTLDLQNRGNVQVEVVDSKGEPDAAAEAVEQLAQKGAVAILGPLGIAEGLAAATRAQQLGVPIVSLSRA
ncbi:MAG TPA: ABC transporter substrate-binding protein, partial [Myxococcales bacterium]